MAKNTMRIGVVGCGEISDIYISNMMNRFSNLEVVACCAKHFESAQRKAKQYGLIATTFEDMLEMPDIDMTVILTPAPTHYELIRRSLEAGKHVYTEKMITLEKRQADELVQLANERQLYLGSAPDTFLGAALQTARKAIDDGLIGEPTGFVTSANRDLDNLAAHVGFLRMPGGGICYDYGVYYLTALVSLLGPMARVSAMVGNRKPVRVNPIKESPDFGKEFEYDNESYVSAILETKSGISGCFSLNGDSVLKDRRISWSTAQRACSSCAIRIASAAMYTICPTAAVMIHLKCASCPASSPTARTAAAWVLRKWQTPFCPHGRIAPPRKWPAMCWILSSRSWPAPKRAAWSRSLPIALAPSRCAGRIRMPGALTTDGRIELSACSFKPAECAKPRCVFANSHPLTKRAPAILRGRALQSPIVHQPFAWR